jgi:hypothetical protein
MSTNRPIVFLAFADARSDLSALKVEGWSLKDQFDELKRRGVIADVVVEEKASLKRIYSVFQKYRDRIALFHFGGHADGDRLLLQSAFELRLAYSEGLATAWERGTEAVSNGILTALAAIFAPRAIGSLLGVEGAGAAGAGAEGAGIAVEKGTEAGVGAPLDLSTFRNAQLRGGTSIESITMSEEPIVDVSGGPALGHTSTNLGTGAMEIEIAPGLSPEEQSITIYHEVIEVASLQAKQPPPTVLDLSEQEIDLLAKTAHEQYGLATVETLNHLLRDLGF